MGCSSLQLVSKIPKKLIVIIFCLYCHCFNRSCRFSDVFILTFWKYFIPSPFGVKFVGEALAFMVDSLSLV